MLLHSDIDVPFAKEGSDPAYLKRTKDLFSKHRKTTTIWAHTGVGRIVHPIKNHCANLAGLLTDQTYSHVYLDISWDQTAKYVIDSPEATKIMAGLLESFPDRILFGTDAVGPANEAAYRVCYERYEPLWKALSAESSRKVRLENYERLFEQSRRNIRNWENAHVPSAA